MERYSNRAVRLLQTMKLPVVAVGRRKSFVNGQEILPGRPDIANPVHTVSLYLNPMNQREYYDYILSLRPERVIFNPGTTNPDFESMLTETGIEVVNGCMLAMLQCGRF